MSPSHRLSPGDAYAMGVNAFQTGEPSSMNPFTTLNALWRDQWYDGWNDAWIEDIWGYSLG